MRYATWLLLTALVLAPVPAAGEEEPAPGIDWQPDLAKAKKAAVAAGKPLLLYFTFDT
jgi:hypothetical protein